jgi:hypothetical protein
VISWSDAKTHRAAEPKPSLHRRRCLDDFTLHWLAGEYSLLPDV